MKRFLAIISIALMASACESINWDQSEDMPDPYSLCRDQGDRYPGAYEDCVREHQERDG